jgi:hypothetical protein
MADKIPAARVGLTCGRPMVITENPNAGQMQREKTLPPKNKLSAGREQSWGVNLPVIPRSFMCNPDFLS